MTVLCQWCGALNPEDRETCLRCKSNLLVFSGNGEPFEEGAEESFEREKIGLDEHLLERLSDSEETVKRLSEALLGLEERVSDLEQGVALLESGLKALVDLLDRRKVIREAEVMAAWERSASTEMAREELLDRLRERRDVVVSRARTAGEVAARTTEQAMRSAELALLAGKPLQALDTLAEALRRAPRNPELACLLGELVFEREDLARSEAYFREAVRLDPAAVEPRIFLGAILADTGREEQACRELERASQLAPESFLPRFALGSLHAAAGNHAVARRHLRAALDRDVFPQAQVLLGLVELDAGRKGAACKVLEEAVTTAPDYEEAIYSLGLAYLERGWRRKALECFHRVLELDPQRLQFQETVRLLEGIGEGLAPLPAEAGLLLREASDAAETGEVDRALKQLSRALEITEHPNILASMALLAAVAGRHRQALAVAHRLLRSEARGAAELAAWTAVLETLRATRRFRFADRCGRKLLQDGEGDLQRAVAAYELSLIELERGGDAAHALELAHSALELIPRELRQHPLTALGRIHLKREEYSDAVDYLEQAAALAASPTVLTHLGLALLGRGDGDRAREVLQQARGGSGRDLKTDVLTHVTRAGFLAAHGRRRG